MRSLSENSADSTFELAGSITIYTFLLILLTQLVISLISSNRGQCSYAIWHNISYLTLIHWLPLIDLNKDSELEFFFRRLGIIFRPFELPSLCKGSEVTISSYKNIKINSNGFINNAKELLLVYILVLFCCFSIIIAGKFVNKPIIERLKKEIKWNVLIRLHLVLFLDFIIFAVIDIRFYNAGESCSEINLILSLFFIITGAAWIIFLPVMIKQRNDKASDIEFVSVFDGILTLVYEFKPIFEVTKYQYYPLQLVCRFSLAFCIVFLNSSQSVQLLMISGFEIIMMIYIVFSRPFQKRFEGIIVFLSELSLLILVILIGIRSMDTLSESNKYNASISCVSIIWLTELLILLRFILRIIYYQDHPALARASATAANNSIMPITTMNAEDRNHDLKSIHSSKISVYSIERLSDNTQLADRTEIYMPNEQYTYINTRFDRENYPNYVHESEGTERKVMTADNDRVIRSANQAMPRLNLFTERASTAKDSSMTMIDPNNLYSSPSARAVARHLEEVEEKAKIKDFLSKLHNEHIKVGNKGLNLAQHSAG